VANTFTFSSIWARQTDELRSLAATFFWKHASEVDLSRASAQLGKIYNTRANSVARQWSNEQRAAKLSTLASKQESVARKVISLYVTEKHRDLGKSFQSALGLNENLSRNGTPLTLTVIRPAIQAVIGEHSPADIQLYAEYLCCRDPVTWRVLGDALESAGSWEDLCRPHTSEELNSLDEPVPLQPPASADKAGGAESVPVMVAYPPLQSQLEFRQSTP
jgi:hypothetical protein